MKKTAFLIGLLFTFGILANAQSSKQIAVHVPFDFYVQGQKMMAGDYLIESVSRQSLQSALIFRQKAGKAKMVLMTIPLDVKSYREAPQPTLIFNRYGDSYFLSEIRNPLENLGFGLRTSKEEKYLAKKSGPPVQETVVMSSFRK